MNTIRVKATNEGFRGQIFKTYDGTVEVPSGRTMEIEILPLTKEQEDHYAARGIKFSPVRAKGKPKPSGGSSPSGERAALEKAVQDAAAELVVAEEAVRKDDSGEAELEALDAAQKNLSEAEAALEALGE